MEKLQEIANKSFAPVLNLIPQDRWRSSNKMPIQVMDDATYQLLQINDLFETIDFTRTRTGSLVLRRSLHQPLTNAFLITEKQKSVDELRSDKGLRRTVTRFVEQTAKDEESLYNYYKGRYHTGLGSENNIYNTYKGSRRLLLHLMTGLRDLEPQSDYLRALTDNLTDLREDDVSDLIRGPIYKTSHGIRRPDDVGTTFPEPFIEFKATDFKTIRLMITGAPILGALSMMVSGNPDLMALGATSIMFLAFYPLAIQIKGRRFDDKHFVRPLRDIYFSNPKVVNALESLGKIDELLSLADYADCLETPVTLPETTDAPAHLFQARNLKNPILAKKNPAYVGNDVDLSGARVTFITGPNSGGKTSLSKTILQSQVLAQIGSYIPAESAKIAVADGIFYHSPMNNTLQNSEGRFGVEIARTSDIFFRTTPRTLVALDELIEATTYEEKMQNSAEIIEDFSAIGGSTILVTHNHELVEFFRNRCLGQNWQVEFDGDKPTHKIVPGISTDSHADKVMERLSFTRATRRRYIENLGPSR